MRTVLPLLLGLCLALPALAAPSSFTGRVTAVGDGDSITVLTRDKQQVRVRLYGIDCPESGQAFGKRAKQATANAVHGKTVTVQPIEKDHYGRTVATVFLPDGRSLNMHLVREGMAWVYSQHCKLDEVCEPLRRLEHAAMEQKRGLWKDREPVPPWEWKKAKSQ